MSEKLLSFPLNEMKAVRVRHKACEGAVEIPLAELPKFAKTDCPLCGNPLGVTDERSTANLLQDFCQALAGLKGVGRVDVSFVFQAEEASARPGRP